MDSWVCRVEGRGGEVRPVYVWMTEADLFGLKSREE